MKRIVLSISALILVGIVVAQTQVSGIVVDQANKPLPGANVVIEKLGLGTITDKKGEFKLEGIENGTHEIKISFLGFESTTMRYNTLNPMPLKITLETGVISGEEIIVRSTRASASTPTTFTEVTEARLEKNNLGQDVPFLLAMEPSLVTSSDAGAGIGYSSLWIRGSNIQRINVTVNGVPINDPESHGVFWVNMPDFASSVESAQVQRGVGTSTNGGGAFGATLNMETNRMEENAFAEINSSAGSFSTFKNTLRLGTGLINEKWAVEGRLSKISSDGYIDRANSDLQSYFVQGGYYTPSTTLKAVLFGGKEKTYQAWYGLDKWSIENLGRTFNSAGAVFGNTQEGNADLWNYSNVSYFYENQTDNYQQDHYQLHWTQKIAEGLSFNSALHYTYGRGFYEEYNQAQQLSEYPIGNLLYGYDSILIGASYTYFYHDTVKVSDLITRRWLDNHFFGATYSFNYSKEKLGLIIGGAWNKYANARHFGEIIWAQFTGTTRLGDVYYDNVSDKTDFNLYAKGVYSINTGLGLFLDLQMRKVAYSGNGTDNGGALIDIDEKYTFINPKAGFTYKLPKVGTLYASVAIANREPIRTDFLDAPEGIKPAPEMLLDYEFGLRNSKDNLTYSINTYLMQYSNQLVLTGQINDVGSPIRANVGESYRAGLEFDGMARITDWFSARANAALSKSNTSFKRFEDSVIVEYKDVQLSFSPQVVAGLSLNFNLLKNLELSHTTKFVSRQFLDLTQTKTNSLDAYTTSNLRLNYTFSTKSIEEIGFTLLVNNLYNAMYSSNGYMYWGTAYFYPQAGLNYLAGVNIRF